MSPMAWEDKDGEGAGERLEQADLFPLVEEGQQIQLALGENWLQS